MELNKKSKTYSPTIGSANYALLLSLYKAYINGQKEVYKSNLMKEAHESGLSRCPILPMDKTSKSKSKQFFYHGWSNFQKMRMSEPALVETHGRPLMVTITDAGIELAMKWISENETVKIYIEKQINRNNLQIVNEDEEDNLELIEELDEEIEENDWILPKLLEQINKSKVREIPRYNPEMPFLDEYEIIMILDSREKYTLNEEDEMQMTKLRENGISVEKRTLEIGDVIWIAQHRYRNIEYVLEWIIERKEIGDLISSIISGRYDRQKYWMKTSKIKNIIYLVEGDPDQYNRGENAKTAILTTELEDGFKVFQTRDVNETFKLYEEINEFIKEKYKEMGEMTEFNIMTYNEFTENLRSEKSLKLKEYFGLMLMKIPNIGADNVMAILNKCPTPISCYRWIKGLKEGYVLSGIALDNLDELCVNEISKLPLSNGRLFGLNCAKLFYEYLGFNEILI